MSTLNLFKRFISIFLVFSVALSLPASQAVRVDIDIANGADGIFTESEEHEKSLRSLMTQLGTSGIKAWGVTGGEVLASPSGRDHRARVSCVTPKINATYDAPQTATVIFKLNTPNERDVSFTYTIYSGSASYNEHFTVTSSGTVIFEAGVVEKELVIEIPKLINNPSEYELPSKPGEFWTKDRVFT